MTAEETRVRGAHQALTPVVDVAREPRWGRVEETFGEDPWLVARMGVAAVRGFQGDASFTNTKHVVATLKHFAAHGEPEAGMNCAPANISERVLRDVFLAPFRTAIEEAGAISVMASYNEIDGVPSHANEWLLRNILRDEWGFDGFVVSDYYAIWELHYRPGTHGHFVAHDKKEACALAVRAGVNIELPEPDCYLHLRELVQEGTIDESQIDSLIEPMLRWKFRMGLFENPFVDPDEADRIVGSTKNRTLVRKAARECITLLENRDQLLPLDPQNANTIAVIGPNANRSLLGGYSGVPKTDSTVLEGITQKVGGLANVGYAEGCKITVGGSWNEDAVVAGNADEDRRLIAEAVALAQESDVVILAIGGNEQTAREAWSRTHMGDRTSLELVGRQQELIDAIAATGKPIVACVFNGRPLVLSGVREKVSAVLECWYLGQETGNALADVIFGDFNPGGKLPITIPRSVGHLPAFYNHKPSARRGFLFDDVSPLYPFGFGLSYTSFEISTIQLSSDSIPVDGSTEVSADVTNTGDRAGSEVLQLYIRDCVSSVTRPIKELKGFERVYLQPGQTQRVTMEIAFEQLAFHDLNMNRIVEPGMFEVMVGTSSRDADLSTVTLHVVR
jgi:beta-glucosidase